MTAEATQRILDSVGRDEMLRLAQELIRIPSFKTEESDVARFLGEYLGGRGYEVDSQEVEPGRFQTVAILRGSGGGKSLMLNGHIDIDPLAMGWKRDPRTPSFEGDFIFGGGIRNMKSGVSSLVTAAEAIRKSGVSLDGDLVLACVAGELQGGVGTTYLCRNGPLTDMAVVPDPSAPTTSSRSTPECWRWRYTSWATPVTSAARRRAWTPSPRCARPCPPLTA